jgi:hypothetical protein
MNDSRTEAYVHGFQAARREGPYAHESADVRCPYEKDTPEYRDWRRGFEDASRAQDATG